MATVTTYCDEHKPGDPPPGFRTDSQWWVKNELPAMTCCLCSERAAWVVCDYTDELPAVANG